MEDNRFFIVIGLDIEGYTNKTQRLQYDAQVTLEQWIVDSSRVADIAADASLLNWIDTGDGGFLLFEGSYSKALTFLERIYFHHSQHNHKSTESAAINVRAAIHCADAIRWRGLLGVKFSGNVVNVCARLLNGMSRRYSNQVIASREYLTRISAPVLPVSAVRMSDHVDKHGCRHEVWNIQKRPGFGVRPHDDDLHEDISEWDFTG